MASTPVPTDPSLASVLMPGTTEKLPDGYPSPLRDVDGTPIPVERQPDSADELALRPGPADLASIAAALQAGAATRIPTPKE